MLWWVVIKNKFCNEVNVVKQWPCKAGPSATENLVNRVSIVTCNKSSSSRAPLNASSRRVVIVLKYCSALLKFNYSSISSLVIFSKYCKFDSAYISPVNPFNLKDVKLVRCSNRNAANTNTSKLSNFVKADKLISG